MIGIGIDTGGTYTDAVLYDMETKEILGAGKSLTTKNELEIGITNALDKLPQDLMRKAEMLALSTTLATNACVENKGARAKLLMIGFEWSMINRLKDVYASYGFRDMGDFVVLDAKVENLFPDAFDPDWEELENRAQEYFGEADAVGVVQKHPRSNGARFEKTARKILEKKLDVPITIASDISDEIDILRCSTGTMLNARLIPLLEEFIKAVKHVLADRELHIPIAIVRSDGSLMSEQMTSEYPVETLLSGPAASVIGGSHLAEETNGIIVDMGGTTTDIAIVRNHEPVMAKKGIQIGQWTTMVKGLYVDTFGLGGDSAVRFKDRELYLDTVRVIPISLLASQYKSVLPKLQDLADRKIFHGRWVHEFYVLVKDIEGKPGYSEKERAICRALKDGPLITLELAKLMDTEPRYLEDARLLDQGIIMKSGLTPTDMMVIKGEFNIYSPDAALAAIESMKKNIRLSPAEVPDEVYRMVEKKMYMNLGRILIGQQYPGKKGKMTPEERDLFLGWCYEQAEERLANPDSCWDLRLALSTDMPLIGVGAPIHIFLPKVACLLGTRAVIPSHAGVANALGAIASRIITRVSVRVKAEYTFGVLDGYAIFDEEGRHLIKEYPEALDFAEKLARRLVLEKSRKAGASENPEVVITRDEIKSEPGAFGILFETMVTAVATDTFMQRM